MPLTDVLLPEFDEEMAATRKILERVPEGKPRWQAHPKSMTFARLATHVAQIPQWTVNSVTKEELDIAPPGAPPTKPLVLEKTSELLALFDEKVREARAALAQVTDADLSKPWTFKVGGKTFWTKPRYHVYRRMMLNHLVHHRAQLGVYLRLNGVPVPGMYGPSADEK